MTTETTKATTYTVRGSVRGTIATGLTLEQAARRMDGDKRDCRKIPGGHAYSDAKIYRDDGETLDNAEWERIAKILNS